MSKQSENAPQSTQLVYCVVRYGQIVGVYANIDDATQVQKVAISKGQVCDLIVKPLLTSNVFNS